MELGLYVRLWQVLHGVSVRVDLVVAPPCPSL
jgi:hypothetical protein